MTIAEQIVELLRQNPDGLSDAELARRTGKRHQQVNQRCRRLEEQGQIVRNGSSGVIVNRIGSGTAGSVVPASASAPADLQGDACQDWFWEGNVQSRLCGWLARQGWSLIQVMNTATRQHGTDIEACRGGARLHVEVKGYPSTSYADPRRGAETKPTRPSTQAGHWYAQALLKAVRLRDSYPVDAVALAFPDCGRYRALVSETERSLAALHIDVLLIDEGGGVVRWPDADAAPRAEPARPGPESSPERYA